MSQVKKSADVRVMMLVPVKPDKIKLYICIYSPPYKRVHFLSVAITLRKMNKGLF